MVPPLCWAVGWIQKNQTWVLFKGTNSLLERQSSPVLYVCGPKCQCYIRPENEELNIGWICQRSLCRRRVPEGWWGFIIGVERWDQRTYQHHKGGELWDVKEGGGRVHWANDLISQYCLCSSSLRVAPSRRPLARNYGKRPKNARTHGPFLKPHIVATWFS